MGIETDGQLIVTIHDFKTHISKYIRMLERGAKVVRGSNRIDGRRRLSGVDGGSNAAGRRGA